MAEESRGGSPSAIRSFLISRYQLDETINALGLTVQPEAIERLDTFVRLLLKWNRTYNLSGARDEKSLVQDHLIDCLAIVPIIKTRIEADARLAAPPLLIDVGSGAGFPGLIVAAMEPGWHIALVEPISKKAAFLQQAIAALRLSNVRVVGHRLEQSASLLAEGSPNSTLSTWHFTSRAVASLSSLVQLIEPLARPGSRLFAMRSQLQDERVPGKEVATHSLKTPGSTKQRAIAEILLKPVATAGAQSDVDIQR